MLRSAIAKSFRPLSSSPSSSLSFPISSTLTRPYSYSTTRPAFKSGPRRTDRTNHQVRSPSSSSSFVPPFTLASSLSRSQHSSAPSSESRSTSDISSSSSSSPYQSSRDFIDPFASFDLLRRQVDRMFMEFDRQMFGGLTTPFFIDDPFESERKSEGVEGGRSKQQKQLSGNGMSGSQNQINEGEGEQTKDQNQDQDQDQSQIVLQAVDGSNDVGEKNENGNANSISPSPTTMSTNQRKMTHSWPSRSSLFSWPFDLSSSASSSSSSSSLSPLPRIRMDLIEEKNQYVLHADVPGFNRDELKLRIQDGMLTLSGETKTENEQKDESKKYHRIERSSGKMVRSIRLPMDVKEDEIRANCENGVLKVVIPKDEAVKNRKQEKAIQIQ